MRSLKRIFILVPSASMSSPVKGAVALANALCRSRPVTMVALKEPREAFELLHASVERISLRDAGTWPARLFALRRLLRAAGGRSSTASVSFCLSADFFNAYCSDVSVTCSSVRGNLPQVYPETYGRIGRWLAHRHLRMLRRMDHIVSMTSSMAAQVERLTGQGSAVIRNFIDEPALDRYRRAHVDPGAYRFAFTGSMLAGKRPDALIDAMDTLQRSGTAVRLDVYGDGPLLPGLKARAERLPQPQEVCFHGHVNDPYEGVAAAHALVLPSVAEGTSRSALEALFLGVPCVLRDVDGSSELIHAGVNGSVFTRDEELATVMRNVAQWSALRKEPRQNLLPPAYRQDAAAEEYLRLLEG